MDFGILVGLIPLLGSQGHKFIWRAVQDGAVCTLQAALYPNAQPLVVSALLSDNLFPTFPLVCHPCVYGKMDADVFSLCCCCDFVRVPVY